MVSILGTTSRPLSKADAEALRLPDGWAVTEDDDTPGAWVVEPAYLEADESEATARLGIVAGLVANGYFPKPFLDAAWRYAEGLPATRTGQQLTPREAMALRLPPGYSIKVDRGEWVVDANVISPSSHRRVAMVAYLVANGWATREHLDDAWMVVDGGWEDAPDPLAGTWGAPMECLSQSELDEVRQEGAERLKVLEATDTSWPLRDILTRLADGADHLLRDHNCDQHGYEELTAARDAARRLIAKVWNG